MIKLNFKIALRNLLKNKKYALINIFGLSVGLAGFIVILLYINLETGYDKWDPSLKNVYQIGLHTIKNEADQKTPKIDNIFIDLVKKNIPEVEAITFGRWNDPYSANYEYNKQKIEQPLPFSAINRDFFNIYPIKAEMGSFEDIFLTKNTLAISLTDAKAIFGNENPINKVLTRKAGSNYKDEYLTVKAVWDDKKYPAYFNFKALAAFDGYIYGEELPFVPFSVMAKLSADADPEKVLARMNALYLEDKAKRAINNSDPGFKLTSAKAAEILKTKQGISLQEVIMEPLSDLNLKSYFTPEPKQKIIYILSALASFLIIITCVNFTNLAVVQANSRAKEVGVKKVLGSFRSSLITQFLLETAIQCLTAFFISIILAELILPSVNELLDTHLVLFSIVNAREIFMQALLILIGVIILSGIYPALFLSGFKPASVLKGNFATGATSVTLRKSLMMVQFTIAGALVTCFMVMNTQLNFMKNKDLGMQPDQVMVLAIQDFSNRTINAQQFEATKQRFLNIKGVQMVSRSADNLIGPSDWKNDVTFRDKTLNIDLKAVDPDYFKLISAKMTKGRDFSMEFLGTDSTGSAIMNETAFKLFGLNNQLGDVVHVGDDPEDKENYKTLKVVGVVKDMQIEGFDKAINPVIYIMDSGYWRKKIYLKIDAKNSSATIAAITKLWKSIEPKDEPFYTFADEKFAKLNVSYEKMSKIMFSFSAITLFVSILGLFTLAAYSSKTRLKEIAIRKILGASTASILKLLSSDLVKVVVLANILGDVAAYIYMNQWFKGFVYRIDMPVLPFLLVNIGTIVLTVITVSLQSYKAVNANPATALKYE